MTITNRAFMPALETGEEIVLDFSGVEAATQSFIHTLISDALRRYGSDALEKKIVFKGCNTTVRKVIDVVVDYMQEV